MMNFITTPLIVGIVFAGIYGLFELFLRRKERMAIIEKLSDKQGMSSLEDKLHLSAYSPCFSFSSLKIGCLFSGLGLGMLVGFIMNTLFVLNETDDWYRNEIADTAYGASVLLFGGIGLIVAFVKELKMGKK